VQAFVRFMFVSQICGTRRPYYHLVLLSVVSLGMDIFFSQ